MSKKIYIVIGAIVLAGLIGGGIYFAIQSQQNQFVNFKDPKLTNNELVTIEGKIKDLENAVKNQEASGDLENEDKKSDLFKLKMELSSYYRLRGRLLDARKAVEEASKLKPDNISPYNELYVIDQLREDYVSAEQDLKKSIAINSNNPQAWRWYFELAETKLEYSTEQLQGLYKDALSQTSENPDILGLYAGFLEKQNDLVGAVAQWKKAIEKNPAGQAQYQAEIERIQNKLK